MVPDKLQYIDLHFIFLDIQECLTYEIMSNPILKMTKKKSDLWLLLPNFDPICSFLTNACVSALYFILFI